MQVRAGVRGTPPGTAVRASGTARYCPHISITEPARLSFGYRLTRRDGLRQFAAASPAAGLGVLLLLVDSVLMWDLPASRYWPSR